MRRLSLSLVLLATAIFAADPVFAKGKSGSHTHHSSSGSHHSATHHSSSHPHPGNHKSSTKHSTGVKQHTTKGTQRPPSANGANNSTPAPTTTTTPAASRGVTSHGRSSLTHSGGYHRGYRHTYRHVSHRRNLVRPSFLIGPDQTVVMNSGARVVAPWATILSAGSNRQGGRALHFEVTGNSNSALFAQAASVLPTGTLTFTPAIGQSGAATITLVLRSSSGSSAPQTFQITVKPA